jgi:vitamin B12 transporter
MSTGRYARRALSSAALVFCVGFSAPAWSNEPELTQVIVTASRVPEPVVDSFWSTSVFTRADIEARQVQSVPDLLADLAGINIDNAGGLGQQSSVFIRGADSDHTLLLIDGVRVGSATLGTAPLEIIPLEQIDHIEVVRGPRSTLYGSDAVGGVIQIFTRHAAEPGVSFGGSAMDGSHDTHEFSGNLAARGERLWASLAADTLTTGGIATCLPGAATAGAGCFLDNPGTAPKGYHNHSGSLNAGVKLTDDLTAQADALYSDGWTAFDGSFDNNLAFTEKVTTLHLDQALAPSWHLRLLGARDLDQERDFLDLTPVGTFNTTRNSASLQIDGKPTGALRLLGGVDYEHVKVDSDTPYEVTARTTRAVFAELRAEFGAWSALAGGRLEHNGQFGHHSTGNVGLTRKLSEAQRFTVTWGTAFRAPTFDELYFPGFGNPNLTPETSRSVEAGIDGEERALRWSLHAYQTDISHLIALDPATFLPLNIAQARIRGVELQADWHASDWGVGGQLTGMQPLNLSAGPEHDNLLNRRAKQNAALTVRRALQAPLAGGIRGSVAVVSRWQGRRFDDLANTLPMGGYLTVDLLTQWAFGGGWSLEARAGNLFDRAYQTAAYFAQDGRHYGVTVRYQLQAK